MANADHDTLRGRGAERARAANLVPLTCPLCHRPAVKVPSVDASVTTIQVQCTGCLHGFALSYQPQEGHGDDES
jgi:hypothetical protein